MLEKLLLAVIITFCLKLFLGVSFPTPNPSTSTYDLLEMPTQEFAPLFSHQP